MEVGERVALEKFPDLDAAQERREPQVEVEDVDRPEVIRLAIAPHAESRVQDAAPFRGREGEIDVLRMGQRETAEDRVAVVPAPANPHVREVGPVAEPQHVAQDIHLAVAARAARAFVHFLEQDEVRFEKGDRITDALRGILPVHSPDPLVDVVRHDPHPHG